MEWKWLKDLAEERLGISDAFYQYFESGIFLVILAFICWIAWYLTKKILLSVVHRYVRKTAIKWDDVLLEKGVFNTSANIVPAILVDLVTPYLFQDHPGSIPVIQGAARIFLIVVIAMSISSLLTALHHILFYDEKFKDKPLGSFAQLGRILSYTVAGLLILSILLDKNPVYFLSALGAISAVLLLIFKDTLLGFVASIQVSANDMVQVGDWISMDKYGANGYVTQINLATVKVQNWDHTITTIPPYSFISDSFQNWRGMLESEGRRFYRSFHIKMNSVRFCTPEMLESFKEIPTVRDYIQEREKGATASPSSSLSEITNLEVFRHYATQYIGNHPDVNQDLLYQVRQLDPSETGIPIQIYGFSRLKDWVDYEKVVAEIMEHLLASLHWFGLEIFESPTGGDIKELIEGREGVSSSQKEAETN